MEKQVQDDVPNRRITDFSAARERSWRLACHPWIFWLDADEVPAPELLDRVAEIVTRKLCTFKKSGSDSAVRDAGR